MNRDDVVSPFPLETVSDHVNELDVFCVHAISETSALISRAIFYARPSQEGEIVKFAENALRALGLPVASKSVYARLRERRASSVVEVVVMLGHREEVAVTGLQGGLR